MNAVATGWLSANVDKFTPQDYEVIKAKLEKADDAVAARVAGTQLKDPGTAFLIALLTGSFASLTSGTRGAFGFASSRVADAWSFGSRTCAAA